MRKYSWKIVLLAVLVVVLTSCEGVSTSPESPAVQGQEMGRIIPGDPPELGLPSQYYLSYWFNWGDHAFYDVIEGEVIHHDEVFVLSGEAPSWSNAGYEGWVFTLTFTAGAIPTDVTHIELHIPQFHSNPPIGEEREPLFKVIPDMTLNGRVYFDVHQPPWLPTSASYGKFCVWKESENPDVFGYSDHERVFPSDPEYPRNHITWCANHCSRWALDDGKGSGPGIGDQE